MKIFKNIRGIICVVALLTLSFGCEDILEQEPVSQIGEAAFWQTQGDAVAGVAAIYDAMQQHYKSRYFKYGEMRSDNFEETTQSNDEALQLLGNILNENSGFLNWSNLYKMILRANLAINNIPNINGDVNNLLAEAHALRAFAYFDAVRVWGDVPLYTARIANLEDNLFRPATSGDEIMQNVIIPDLLKAEELMKTNRDRFRFSKASIYSLQAEVYAWIGDNVKAKEAVDKLMDLGGYSLVTTPEEWHALFRNEPPGAGLSSSQEENGPELIFSIYNNIEEDGNRASEVSLLFWAGVPSYHLATSLEEKWQETFPIDEAAWMAKYPDYLPKNFDEDGNRIYGDYHRYLQVVESEKEVGDRRYGKYNTFNYSVQEDDTDIVIFRWAGMLLLKAEIEAKLGNKQVAVDIVNQIRAARDLPGIDIADYPTDLDMVDGVLQERQFELLAEGERYWDLVRNNKIEEVMGPINGQTNATVLFPIYFQHLVDNPSLEQVAAYR